MSSDQPPAPATKTARSSKGRWAAMIAIVAAIPMAMFMLFSSSGSETANEFAEPKSVPNRTCLEWDANPPSVYIFDQQIKKAHNDAWLNACKQAADTDSSARVMRAYGRVLMVVGNRSEALAAFQIAAGQGDATAFYEIYELYRSWERSDPIEKQRVKRREAEMALRKSAQLGNPNAMLMLTVSLERGDVVKRDIAEAVLWAQRLVAIQPPKDWSTQDAQVMLGRILVKSANASDRARGIVLLSNLPRGDAMATLAQAIRAEQPERARALLEDALRSYPGHAVGPLADMLIKGESGPADPKRALSLLQGKAQDVGLVKAELGKLYLDGKLVPRNLEEATRLISQGAVWDFDLRLLLAKILSENPVSISNPQGLVTSLTEASDVNEPGARSALIDLKMSANPQFADKTGGCELVLQALAAGDEAARRYESACAHT